MLNVYCATGKLEYTERFLKLFCLGEKIIRIKSGYGENAYVVPGKNVRNAGEDSNHRKIQHSLDTETPPSVGTVKSADGNKPGRADQGFLLIG